MSEGVPKLILINHDDYHARHIGKMDDGRQFFLTTPFVPAIGENPGCEFIALFIFDADGGLIKAEIDNLGPRAKLDGDIASTTYEQRLAELGNVTYGQILVAPFEIERYGIKFGLIPRPPEEQDWPWAVILRPGNYMAFFPPWNGEYDT